jgi:hypothetical protein
MSRFRDLVARMAIDGEFARHARSHPDDVARQYGLTAEEARKLRGLAQAQAGGGPMALGARLSKSGVGSGVIGTLAVESPDPQQLVLDPEPHQQLVIDPPQQLVLDPPPQTPDPGPGTQLQISPEIATQVGLPGDDDSSVFKIPPGGLEAFNPPDGGDSVPGDNPPDPGSQGPGMAPDLPAQAPPDPVSPVVVVLPDPFADGPPDEAAPGPAQAGPAVPGPALDPVPASDEGVDGAELALGAAGLAAGVAAGAVAGAVIGKATSAAKPERSL